MVWLLGLSSLSYGLLWGLFFLELVLFGPTLGIFWLLIGPSGVLWGLFLEPFLFGPLLLLVQLQLDLVQTVQNLRSHTAFAIKPCCFDAIAHTIARSKEKAILLVDSFLLLPYMHTALIILGA